MFCDETKLDKSQHFGPLRQALEFDIFFSQYHDFIDESLETSASNCWCSSFLGLFRLFFCFLFVAAVDLIFPHSLPCSWPWWVSRFLNGYDSLTNMIIILLLVKIELVLDCHLAMSQRQLSLEPATGRKKIVSSSGALGRDVHCMNNGAIRLPLISFHSTCNQASPVPFRVQSSWFNVWISSK